jgi:hypothetical protein
MTADEHTRRRIDLFQARQPDIGIISPDQTLSGQWAAVAPGTIPTGYDNAAAMIDGMDSWYPA